MLIIFFDGSCLMCNRFANWIQDHDITGIFKMAPLQGKTSRDLLKAEDRNLDSIILWKNEVVYKRSDAIIFIMTKLPGKWRALQALRYLPRWLRDSGYSLIAKTRYGIFARSETCRIVKSFDRDRFLP